MSAAQKKWAIALLAVAVLGIAVTLGIAWHVPQPEISASLALRQPSAERGEYVARLGDCTACHTTPNGKAFAGGLPFPTPVGTIYSTNITPDRANGIGAYSFEDFVRVMRFGVKPDGTRLYPAMPYTAYAKVSDEDLQDLFAYLRQSIAPVSEPPRPGSAALAAQQPLAAGVLEHRLP